MTVRVNAAYNLSEKGGWILQPPTAIILHPPSLLSILPVHVGRPLISFLSIFLVHVCNPHQRHG